MSIQQYNGTLLLNKRLHMTFPQPPEYIVLYMGCIASSRVCLHLCRKQWWALRVSPIVNRTFVVRLTWACSSYIMSVIWGRKTSEQTYKSIFMYVCVCPTVITFQIRFLAVVWRCSVRERRALSLASSDFVLRLWRGEVQSLQTNSHLRLMWLST